MIDHKPFSLHLEQVSSAFLKPLQVSFSSGEFIGILGPNGAGKSMLLQSIAGLIPTRGRICFNEHALSEMNRLERARTLAYLPQETPLHWPLSVYDLVQLGRSPHPISKENLPKEAAFLHALLESCNLLHLQNKYVQELSGGEKARALLARALAVQAPILLVDEPIAALDPPHQIKILKLLRHYAEAGHLILAVLHDLSLALTYPTRLLALEEGSVIADGTGEKLLAHKVLDHLFQVKIETLRKEEKLFLHIN